MISVQLIAGAQALARALLRLSPCLTLLMINGRLTWFVWGGNEATFSARLLLARARANPASESSARAIVKINQVDLIGLDCIEFDAMLNYWHEKTYGDERKFILNFINESCKLFPT